MMFFLFSNISMLCVTYLFVVPNSDNADVFMTLKHNILPGTYLITELVDIDCDKESIKTYNQRSELGKNTAPYYFEPITPEEKITLEHLLNCYKILNPNDKDKINKFLKSEYVDLTTVNTYVTSEPIVFNDSINLYNLEFRNSYKYFGEQTNPFIPAYYLNNLLKFSGPKTIKKYLNRSNHNESFVLKNDINTFEAEDVSQTKHEKKIANNYNIDSRKIEVSDEFVFEKFDTNLEYQIRGEFPRRNNSTEHYNNSVKNKMLKNNFLSKENIFEKANSSSCNEIKNGNKQKSSIFKWRISWRF
ncbi:putative SP-containing protein [Vairimorpha necatrix]|uniref:SP-containing protein n=1 Tax=Vairimorpha necatrix TaxID=6039 RepID=A0AAX4JEN3_9MICR